MKFEVITPGTTEELLQAMADNQENHFRFGAGCTDLLMELKTKPEKNLIVINLSRLTDKQFTGIEKTERHIRIGSLVTARQLLEDEEIKAGFPVLSEAAASLASMQIREVATVGGNLCTASPSGDIACALTAIEAKCEILDVNGRLRTISIKKFFAGVRKTILQKDEILRSVTIPLPAWNADHIVSGFIKIGTRRSMECSVVSLAYHIIEDSRGLIRKAGIAIGSVAPTIKFVTLACEYLRGRSMKELSEEEKENFACSILQQASPISDIRASEWYRKEVLYNMAKSIVEER